MTISGIRGNKTAFTLCKYDFSKLDSIILERMNINHDCVGIIVHYEFHCFIMLR